MSKCKNWCFTLNNYTNDDITYFQSLVPSLARYICFGMETPHDLQGYIQLNIRFRLPNIQKIHSRAHWTPARGSPAENKQYCFEKEGFREFGTRSEKGQRNDLQLKSESQKLQYERIVKELNTFKDECKKLEQKNKEIEQRNKELESQVSEHNTVKDEFMKLEQKYKELEQRNKELESAITTEKRTKSPTTSASPTKGKRKSNLISEDNNSVCVNVYMNV